MKRVIHWLLLAVMLLVLVSCDRSARPSSDAFRINSYRDIPGVTSAEIEAIEALKAERAAFTYGHLLSTEAFEASDGSYTGFSIELCKLFSELFDTQFVPSVYNDLISLKEDFDAGITDFTGEFKHTPQFMLSYDMTTPIAGRSLKLYSDINQSEITRESDINGMRIAFMIEPEEIELIKELYPDISFELVPVDSTDEAVEMLHSGEIDAIIIESVADIIFEDYDNLRSSDIFPFVYSPVSISSKNAELGVFIDVINKYLDAGGMDVMFRLYADGSYEYKKHKLFLSFTEEERTYLAELNARNGLVNVALQHDAYPASFYNTVENRYDGAAYDILLEVSELTGINFNSDCMPVEKPLSDILAKLKTGEVSMMPQLLYSESRKDDYIWSSVSYITTKYALLSKSDFPSLLPFQVYYANVGTVNKSAHEELFKEFFPDHERNLVYQTGDESFDALERGDIDLLMLSETMLLVQTNYREKLGYKVNLTFDKSLDTLFGFNKDEVILRDIFDKSLAYIDINGIEENWLSRAFDYQSKMLRDAVPFIVLFVVLLLAALFVVFTFYIKNRRLSKSLEETVKKRTEELERKTATLSTIYNSIPDLVFSKDINSIYTSCNPSFEKFAGMSEAELIGKSDIEVFKIDKDMAQLFVEADKKVLLLRNNEKIEELITYPDSSQKLMETVKIPLIQNGEVVGMMGISRDITERKEAESVLEKRLEQQRLMAVVSQNFISDGSVDEQITHSLRLIGEFMGISRVLLLRFANQAFHYQYEWKNPDQNINSKLSTVLPIADSEMPLITAYSQRSISHFTLDGIDRDYFTQRYNLFDLKNMLLLPIYVDNDFWGVLEFDQCVLYSPWTTSDINLGEMVAGILSGAITRQIMEDRLVEAKELAEQNSKAKSDFLSRMSHEMRTPMNAIIGMTSIGKNSDDIERKDYCLSKIDSASSHLLGVINDVLDLSKIEAGKFELSFTDFNLEKMLIKITNVINFRMEEKGQCFTIKVDHDTPQAIISDEQRLSQVITNLIGNAVKFTPDNGAISLFVRVIAKDAHIYTLQFEVKDTGIGIPVEQQHKLFTSFEQGDGSVSRKYGGTGLGLAISKHIIEMMGGDIWVESVVGEGSSFIFNIQAQEGRSLSPARSDADLSGLRILAVDDDPDVREYFISYADSLNLLCEVAENGSHACALIDSLPPFNIFFVDWKMEGMDGIELTKWIKDKSRNNSVVIMISSTEWSFIEADAKLAGVDKFIPKPLFSSVLTDCIRECIDTHNIDPSDTNPELDDFDCFHGLRILLAEDVDINREIIATLLEPTGLIIDCAEDGAAAFRMFKDFPDYDMIFMDIHMPEVDGYTSTRMIRALPDPRAKSVPIIAMTANVFREDIERCLDAGMNAHIGKPIDFDDVMANLRKFLPPLPELQHLP